VVGDKAGYADLKSLKNLTKSRFLFLVRPESPHSVTFHGTPLDLSRTYASGTKKNIIFFKFLVFSQGFSPDNHLFYRKNWV
jgi:hypothetical protein